MLLVLLTPHRQRSWKNVRRGWDTSLEVDGIGNDYSLIPVKIYIKYKLQYQVSEQSTNKEKFKIWQGVRVGLLWQVSRGTLRDGDILK